MVKFKLKNHQLFIALTFVMSSSSFAEITLINKDHIFNDQDNFKLTTYGGLRMQALNFDQYNDSNSSQKYQRNGYSATSRMYANADYKVNDDLNLIAGYQNFINPAKILDWDGHYRKSDKSLTTEQAYFGISSKTYGTLKYGKMYSIYFDVVGSKTDLWDYDTLAQPQAWSPVPYYDGTQASSKTLRYEKKNKKIDFYAAYLFEDETYPAGLRYQRKSGEEVAVDVHINKNLSWATSYKHNESSLDNTKNKYDFSQDAIASALFYFDGKWMFGLGGGWYKNLLPNYNALGQPTPNNISQFLDTEAYGIEYYAGYHFKIADHGIKYIQPFVMGNYLKYTSGYNFSRRDNGVGVAIRFNHGIGFDYERLYTKDTIGTPDMHLFRLRYEW
nr:porin [Acinetobacter sp. Marseille-Q1620]